MKDYRVADRNSESLNLISSETRDFDPDFSLFPLFLSRSSFLQTNTLHQSRSFCRQACQVRQNLPRNQTRLGIAQVAPEQEEDQTVDLVQTREEVEIKQGRQVEKRKKLRTMLEV